MAVVGAVVWRGSFRELKPQGYCIRSERFSDSATGAAINIELWEDPRRSSAFPYITARLTVDGRTAWQGGAFMYCDPQSNSAIRSAANCVISGLRHHAARYERVAQLLPTVGDLVAEANRRFPLTEAEQAEIDALVRDAMAAAGPVEARRS
jgi:hypothetical protein